MASLFYSTSTNTSQAAEALLSRARRLSSNAYERTLLPVSFAEGEDHRILVNSTASSLRYHHHNSFNTAFFDSARRRSTNTQLRPRSATSVAPRPSLSSSSSSTPSITTSHSPSSSPSVDKEQDQPPSEPTSTAAESPSRESDSSTKLPANTFLDPQSALNSPCGTSESCRLPIPCSSRPRALTLESNQEAGVSQSDRHKVAVADIRRKHRSENGGSLVLDILIVLRENTELELPKFNRDAGDISPTPDSAEMRTATIPPLMVNEEKICSESTEGPSAMNVDIEVAEPDAGSETGHISPTSVLTVTSVQESTETQNTDAPLQDTGDETMEASASGNAPSLQLVEADAELSPRPPSPTSSRKSTGSASDQEKRDSFKEGKGAFFFHKMGVRKNSFTESSSSSSAASDSQEPTETSNLRPLMSHFSASVPLSTHLSHLSQSGKLTKRASKKLLGKLVPKFLHTSATNSTSETCPLSSRPSRSKSVSGHGPTRAMYSSAVASSSSISSSKESQESLLLDATPETEEEYSDVGSRPPSSMARRSSCCSESSKHSGNSLTSKPLGSFSSVSTTDATEAGSNEKYAIEGQYRQENSDATETGYSEEIIIGNSVEKDEISDHAGVAFDDDPPLSPYIIDENCDDAFFLNSVLRKRSIPTLNMDQQAVMTGSHPSNTTLSSMRSFATTPSMSGGWSSASCSQASTPSPTSPSFMNGQIYPFPSTATDSDTNLNYRTNPLPPPIKTGLDEKRNRLRDAVGEWRRSANASYYVV